MTTMNVAAEKVTTTKRLTLKLDNIRQIELQMQKLWTQLKIFEADAPTEHVDK
jgi:hypothetical protein